MEGNLNERDQIVLGRIVAIGEREIVLEVDGKQGVVGASDIEALPADVRSTLQVGDEVYACVVEPIDSNGNLLLSLSHAVDEKDWRYVEQLLVSKQSLEMTITEANKGGVVIKIGRLRGFVPGSQLSDAHQRMLGGDEGPAEERFRKLVGLQAVFKVAQIDRKRKRLILSERAAVKEQRAEAMKKLLTSIAPGQMVDGFVSTVKDFGVFVDLGGADGMIHLFELSHASIGHPSDLLQKGQSVTVKVLSVDQDRGRIALSLKAMQPDPWHAIGDRYQVGQLIDVMIVKVHEKNGALVRLKDDPLIEGLIRIADLSEGEIDDPRDVFQVGQPLIARVLHIDEEKRRMALSLRGP